MIPRRGMRDMFRFYRQSSGGTLTDIAVYRKIVCGFIRFLISKLFSGYDIYLSADRSLGVLAVRGKKVRPRLSEDGKSIMNLAPDWGTTKKLWATDPVAKANKQVIYHFNEHTNGIKYRIRWYREGMYLTNKFLYDLFIARPTKRAISKLICEGREFLVID